VNDSSPQPSPGGTHVLMWPQSDLAYAIPVPKFSPFTALRLFS